MKWPYHPYLVNRSPICPAGIVHRPEAKLRVRGTTGEVYLRPLIDSGADHTILPMSVAIESGAELFVDELDSAQGVGGQEISIVPGRLELELLSDDGSCKWTAIVGFANFENREDECSLLGHAGCLEYFRAAFDGIDRVVELTLRGELPKI